MGIGHREAEGILGLIGAVQLARVQLVQLEPEDGGFWEGSF